jgi:hypothetical protein
LKRNAVMAGLVPAIHDLNKRFDFNEVVDARHEVGHDDGGRGHVSVYKQNALKQHKGVNPPSSAS